MSGELYLGGFFKMFEFYAKFAAGIAVVLIVGAFFLGGYIFG